MSKSRQRRPQFTSYAIGGLVIAVVASYGYVLAHTLTYPFFLDYPEGGNAMAMIRALERLPFYSAPSAEYVPLIYTPLYYYVSAAAALLLGPELPALRVVSVLSTLGICLVTWRFVRNEGGTHGEALVTCGAFIAIAPITGFWFHMGRPDCLFVFLYLWGAYVLRYSRSYGAHAAAALLLAFAFFAKQTALTATAPLLLWSFLSGWRRGIVLCGLYTGAVVLGCLYLHWASEGWSSFYLFVVPTYHPIVARHLLGFWFELLMPFLPLFALSLYLIRRVGHTADRSGLYFVAALCIGCVATSYTSRVHQGGFWNVMIPGYYALIFAGSYILVRAKRSATQYQPAQKQRQWWWLSYGVALQLAVLLYDPRDIVPTPADRAAGERYIAFLKNTPGEVFIPRWGYVQRLAQKTSYGWGAAGWDILRMQPSHPVKEAYLRDMDAAFARGEFEVVLVDPEDRDWMAHCPHFHANYCRSGRVLDDDDSLFPMVGSRVRPNDIYRKCADATVH